MNAVTGLVAIASLLLALAAAGGTAKEQVGVNSQAARPITASKLGANHNETLVRDTTSVQQADTLSQWLTSVQAFVFARSLTYGSSGIRCEDWGCGTNHNETLVSDAAR